MLTREEAAQEYEAASADLVRQMLTLRALEHDLKNQRNRVEDALKLASIKLEQLNDFDDEDDTIQGA